MNNSVSENSRYNSDLWVLGFIVLVKCLIVFWYTFILYSLNPVECVKHYVFIGGDTGSYLDPFNNLFAHGKFYFINEKAEQIFIGRGPYYGVPYFVFRLFFNPANAYIALGVLQLLLDITATFLLYKLFLKFTKNKKAVVPYLLLSLGVILNTILTVHLTTESICMSLSIISLWYFQLYLELAAKKHFWISAFLFCWMVALKPYLLPLGGLLFLLYYLKKNASFGNCMKQVLLFYLPLVIIVAPYTIRNYVYYKRIVPFQDLYAGYGYNDADLSIRRFIQSFGGSIIFWDQNAAGSFFMQNPKIGTRFTFPPEAMASCYTLDSLKLVAAEYAIVNQKNPADPMLINDISSRMDRYTHCLQQEKPMQYFVMSRLELANRFVLKNGSYFLPRVTILQWVIKIMQVILYYLMVLSTIVCTFIVILQFKKTPMMIIFSVISSWYPVLLFPVFLKSDEWRYFDTAYPFMVFLTGYFLFTVLKLDLPKSKIEKYPAKE